MSNTLAGASESSDLTSDEDDDDNASSSQKPEQNASSLSDAKLFHPGSVPDMPAVQQHALDAAKAKKVAGEKAASGAGANLRDSDGRPFNTAWHAVNADGTPMINKDGTVRKLGGRGAPKATGKGPAVDGASQSRLDTSGPAAPPVPDKAEMERKATAALTTQLTFRIAVMLGGKEFEPTPGEPEAFQESYEAVFAQYGISDLPPIAALCAVMFVYASQRWNAPAVIEKRLGIRAWFAHKWVSWRYGKDLKKTKTTRDAHKVIDQVEAETTANSLAMGAPAAH